ncbi:MULTISPECIES: ketol-acid reductoisomerase [unclassified Helicobacter]|uniref:ketol-acid reductoisomerase n=1 Tax=unclassified Helicobacter TaxID=2593540 RepID=UPI000CF15431|nr:MULTISPECIES: ketol-acid reductoisomerase [unclassified Helicobacter]
MLRVYTQQDCNLELVCGKKIAILGFGSQGKAHAQNLRDSGANVIIGLYQGSKSWKIAQDLGFEVFEVSEAVKISELIVFMLPDELHSEVFEKAIKPFLKPHHTLVFCHGFSICFNLITPPQDVGIIMVAPKAQGRGVRNEFLKGSGVPALIAIEQDNKEQNARDLALSYAAGIGSHKSFIIETTFRQEAETDLFGEQAVLCGGLKALIKNAFEVLVEAGYPEELAYFECLHELKLVVDLIYEGGLTRLHEQISNTAEYGMIKSQKQIIPPSTKQIMRELLEKIQDGSFAKDFILEKQSNYICLKAERKNIKDHSIERMGNDLRKKIFKDKLTN